MITEEQAREIIQKSPIFHNHWSSKCQTWFEMWQDLKVYNFHSLLNVGALGESDGANTVRWMNFWRQMFPSIQIIEHLDLDSRPSKVPEKITVGDVRNIDKVFPPNSWDAVFWCQGPEHIRRDEWGETFEKIQKVLGDALVMQCPWGSGYNDDPGHVSPSIRKGEFEQHGFKVLYNGVEDTRDAGIIAYKINI